MDATHLKFAFLSPRHANRIMPCHSCSAGTKGRRGWGLHTSGQSLSAEHTRLSSIRSLETKSLAHKLNHSAHRVYLNSDGFAKERQYRSICRNCGLLLGYREAADTKAVYLVQGVSSEACVLSRLKDRFNF